MKFTDSELKSFDDIAQFAKKTGTQILSKGEDSKGSDPIVFKIVVPKESEVRDDNGQPLQGKYLADTFKKKVASLLLNDPLASLLFEISDTKLEEVFVVKYKERDEKWTKEMSYAALHPVKKDVPDADGFFTV